jgi:phage terminase Nu1 subunit (DNA packaging protein)
MTSMTKILDDYLTRDQLAAELNITVRTLSRWQEMPDGIPHVQVGGRVLYRISSVRAWLEAKERQPNRRRAA